MYAPIKQLQNGGYIALISAILISVSLLIMVVAVSFSGFSSRFTILESELKEESVFLAEACVATARLRLAQDTDYTGGEEVFIDGRPCEIVSVADETGFGFGIDHTIETQGVSGAAVTNLRVRVDASTPGEVAIVTWEEVPSL